MRSASSGRSVAWTWAVPRGLVTSIPQESYVFSGTLRENLALLAGDAELVQVADSVGAAGLSARLGGLDTPVERFALSSGKRQLVALARVARRRRGWSCWTSRPHNWTRPRRRWPSRRSRPAAARSS